MDKTKLYLTNADEGVALSREEFAEADFEGPWQYERHNGKLVVMVPPGFDHQSTTEPFRNHLGAYKLARPDVVQHVFQETWTHVDEDTDRLPDIGVYLQDREGTMPERAPDLIFEIVSQGAKNRRRDYEEKREEYERIGVREYVIVDRFEHRVTVLALEEAGYVEQIMGPDDVYPSSLLPGLEIPLGGVI